jgi:excinuclease ABC subunit B
MDRFEIVSDKVPTGDQPQAIDALSKGIEEGKKYQILMGVTGSGKTFTMANVIARVNRPTLILAHNKTLAAQLCSELREVFPNNAVEYFVSYYDYYQPEAYIVSSDTYIEKDSSINDEIDRLRHSATAALTERRDVIIVASVSCIYSLGSPEEYQCMTISLRPGMQKDRDVLLRELVDIQYDRNDVAPERGCFRARGDVVEIFPVSKFDRAIRVEFFGDEIDRISEIDPLTGEVVAERLHVQIMPASHYATSRESIDRALGTIEADMHAQVKRFAERDCLLEAQRLEQRVSNDIEMMREIGYCTGIENYSRYFDGRKPGDAPFTLLDYFPKDFLLFVDESHVTLPQVRAMFAGDRSRKESLVKYGFRLDAAFDNRPLKFDEFWQRVGQAVFVSATPGDIEKSTGAPVIEQIIRPTGLLDPKILVRPIKGQVDDLYGEIRKCVDAGERVLVTTLTKKMAESLTDYYVNMGVRARYLHSEIDTLERTQILRELRLGKYDVLIGINLLREGLDLPEVSLVAILDADKEGFLRSARSLIQTVGRAARNVNGKVIMYADTLTDSMNSAISETNRRREIQEAYNKAHGIVPRTIKKQIHELLEITKPVEAPAAASPALDGLKPEALMAQLEQEMLQAAKELDFERAASLRDRLFELREEV